VQGMPWRGKLAGPVIWSRPKRPSPPAPALDASSSTADRADLAKGAVRRSRRDFPRARSKVSSARTTITPAPAPKGGSGPARHSRGPGSRHI
jgi:hypothetical protein